MFDKNALPVIVLPPVADAFAGTVVSDYINMRDFQHAQFLIVKGVGTTGTSRFKVLRASDASGTGAEAIPFRYRRIAADRTMGALLDADAANGFVSTAGSEDTYVIDVSTSLEGLADSGNSSPSKHFIAVQGVEVVDSPVAGMIIALLNGPRRSYAESSVA